MATRSGSASLGEESRANGRGETPLSALLSFALVAFTIEFDNEAEFRYRTTVWKKVAECSGSPWLPSMAIWLNCMRFVSEERIAVRRLQELARTPMNLQPLQRWGYVVVGRDLGVKSTQAEESVRVTVGGKQAQEIWRPLTAEIEQRWRDHFGSGEVEELRSALEAVVSALGVGLPDGMPGLQTGLRTQVYRSAQDGGVNSDEEVGQLSLAALLTRALVAFGLQFESESEVALAATANVLRVCPDGMVRVRDLPRLSGVSKEAIAMTLRYLDKGGYVVIESEGEGKSVVLTHKGREARDRYAGLMRTIEEKWLSHWSSVRNLRDVLETLFGRGEIHDGGIVWHGMASRTDGWRTSVPRPARLPHYPMVFLHRGGWPDGS